MTNNKKPDTSVALIDLNYLFKKRYHTIGNETPMAAAKATLRDLENLRRGVGHLIICRDAPPYRRLDIDPKYKANRPAAEPEERAQKIWLFEEIKRQGFNVAWCQGYEADDVIATLAKQYGEWSGDVRIVSCDKDAAQCINDHVTQYIPPIGDKDWEVRDRAAVIEKFGVAPELMCMYQALMGDKDDNVPGVDGIGKVKARELCLKYPTVALLAAKMAEECAAPGTLAYWKNLGAQWETGFMMSLKLVTLDTAVPIDTDSLLVKREPEPEKRAHNDMDVEMDGYIGNEIVGNETPMPPAPVAVVAPLVSPEGEAVFEKAKQVYDARFVANDAEPVSTTAAKDEGLLEQEYEREREREGEHDTTSNEPGQKTAEPARRVTQAMVKATPAQLVHPKYGVVDDKLQPTDLQSAYTVSEWIVKSNLFPQFKTPSQVFVVIAQGKELGAGMMTALANTHMIDGKPVKHADFIRALCEKDPSFEYLYPKELSSTKCVWVGKRKGYPEPVPYPYTIEDAIKAGLARAGNYGDKSNWTKRPQDMLSKTAASKLARILWPAATMGLYCPEEFGMSEEELSQQEAA